VERLREKWRASLMNQLTSYTDTDEPLNQRMLANLDAGRLGGRSPQIETYDGNDCCRLRRLTGATRMRPPRGLSMSAMSVIESDTVTGSTKSNT